MGSRSSSPTPSSSHFWQPNFFETFIALVANFGNYAMIRAALTREGVALGCKRHSLVLCHGPTIPPEDQSQMNEGER
jgi:hypothetical protein